MPGSLRQDSSASRAFCVQEQETTRQALLDMSTNYRFDVMRIEPPERLCSEAWIRTTCPKRTRLVPGDAATQTATNMPQVMVIELRNGVEGGNGAARGEVVLSVHHFPLDG